MCRLSPFILSISLGQNSFGPFITTSNGFNVDTYVATIAAGDLPAATGLALQAYPNPATRLITLVLPI